ncbi:hypothetical protein EASG_05827, partial [Escherichia coli H383]
MSPPWRASIPDAKPPGLQRPFRSRRLCRAVTCAPGIPAKGRRDVRGNAVSRTRSSSLRRVPCPLLYPVPCTRLSPCRRGQDSHNRLRQSRGEMHIP